MSMSWVLCVFMGTLAWTQAQSVPPQSAPANPPAAADTAASVPADAPVITITGVCDSPSKPPAAGAGDCKTIITKAEFEKIAGAIAPNTTPQQKKQLATVLPRLIAMSREAKNEGMDKTEQYDQIVKFAQMQILQNQLQRKIQDDAANVPDADVEKYYHDNATSFEQYNVDRIFIPRTKQAEPDAGDDDKDDKLTPAQQKAKEDGKNTHQCQQQFASNQFPKSNCSADFHDPCDHRPGSDEVEQHQRGDVRPEESQHAGSDAEDPFEEQHPPARCFSGQTKGQRQVEGAIQNCIEAEEQHQRVQARSRPNKAENPKKYRHDPPEEETPPTGSENINHCRSSDGTTFRRALP